METNEGRQSRLTEFPGLALLYYTIAPYVYKISMLVALQSPPFDSKSSHFYVR